MPLLLLNIVELCFQQRKRLRFVLYLGLLRLAVNHDSRGIMGQAHRGIRSVDTLSAVAGRPHYINPYILILNHDINIVVHLGHHCHTDGGCVDAPARLCLRHALYPMHAALILQNRVRALPRHHKGHALHAADADFLHFHGLHFPAASLRIVHIHAVNLRRKESRLVAARTRADFYNHILIVVGILWQKENLQLVLQLLHTLLCLGKFLLQHLPHIVVGLPVKHCETVLNVLIAFFIFFISVYYRSQVTLLLHQRPEPLLVIRHGRLTQLIHNLLKFSEQIFQFIKHNYLRLSNSYSPILLCQMQVRLQLPSAACCIIY